MADRDVRVVLSQVNLVARDVPATVEFYRLLGLDIPEMEQEWASWSSHHRNAAVEGPGAELDFEIDSEAFARYWVSDEVPAGVVLGFRVDSRDGVDALYERLTRAGYRGLRAPYDAFWGARYAIVADPSGVAVGLMSESDASRRSAPPEVGEFT